jgi:hypothetical protein
VYYPQGNGLAESTNKTLQVILRKIVEANRTDWDRKLHSVLWAYRTSYKSSIRSIPFRMALGLEAVMPSEFIVPSLRIQSEYKLNESESEHARVEQLLRLEEERIRSMEALEHEQRLRKAFVDRQRKRKSRIALPVTIRLDARKVTVTVDRTVLDRERGKRHVRIRHAFRRSTTTMGEWISPKTVLRKAAS